MNRKIPFHDLSSLLAESCGITTAEAEDFVRSFFELVTAALVEGEEVTVKGMGTFRRTASPDSPVEFIPDRSLADGINAPFAMFEPELLAPTVTDELLAAEDDTPTPAPELPETTPAVTEIPAEPAPAVEATEVTEVAEPAPSEVAPSEVGPVEAVPAEVAPAETVPEEPATAVETTEITEVAEPELPEPPAEPAPVEEVPVEEVPVEEVPVEEVPAEPAPTEVVPAPSDPSELSERSERSDLSESSDLSAPSAPSAPIVDDEEEYLPTPERQGMSWGWGFVIGLLVGMAVGACAVYFAIDYIFPSRTLSIETVDESLVSDALAEASAALADIPELPVDSVAAPDSIAPAVDTVVAPAPVAATPAPEPAAKPETPAPAAPKAAPVKDTVKAGYLLPTMARKHYGDKNFWVYIYEENKGVISNPNRIRPGLTVVIPPAEKYGIDARNSASVSRAKEKAAEILRKFPN